MVARDADEGLAERAANALLSVPPATIVGALGRQEAARPLFDYAATQLADQPGVADALARHPHCPEEILVRVAGRLSPAAVQALMDDLNRLCSVPHLVEALLASPHIPPEQHAALEDLRKEVSDPGALREAVAAAEPDLHKRETLLQRLAKMHVRDRVRLAYAGGPTERMALIRDPSRMVQRAVLQSPRLTDREVELFATMTNLSEEILRLMAANRQFVKNYVVTKNLAFNPKTPLDVTLHLLARLIPQDLKSLALNKNVPETLRAAAQKLQRLRTQAKKDLEG